MHLRWAAYFTSCDWKCLAPPAPWIPPRARDALGSSPLGTGNWVSGQSWSQLVSGTRRSRRTRTCQRFHDTFKCDQFLFKVAHAPSQPLGFYPYCLQSLRAPLTHESIVCSKLHQYLHALQIWSANISMSHFGTDVFLVRRYAPRSIASFSGGN